MHQPRQQNEHFVAVEMAEAIIDALEEIDVEDREPDVLIAIVPARVSPFKWKGPTGFRFAGPQELRQRAVERLAIEEARQFIIFAVVENLQVILIDAQQAGQHLALIFRQGLGMMDFEEADDASRAGDGEDMAVLTRPAATEAHGGVGIVTGAQIGVRIQERLIGDFHVRIGCGDPIILQTDALAKTKLAGIAGDPPKPELGGRQQLRRHRGQSELELVPVVARSEVGDRFDEMNHSTTLER